MNEAATSQRFDAGAEHRGSGRSRWRQLLVWFGVLVVAFVLYALSFGLVLRLCGARIGGGWPSLPPVVRFIYAPLGAVGGYLPMAYEHYIVWCLTRDS